MPSTAMAAAAATNLNGRQQNSIAESTVVTQTKPPRQRFRHKPEPMVTLTEGNTILLRCEVDNQAGDTQWLKDGVFVFHTNRTPAHNLSSERRNIVGSVERGEHNLELVNARLDDSGQYECQVMPSSDESDDQLRASVQVLVKPQLPDIPSSSSSSSSKQDDAASKQKTGNGAGTSDAIPLTKLPRGASPASSSAVVTSSSAQFLTHQHQQLQVPSNVNSGNSRPPLLMALLLGWPYVLLGLAGLLMLANIYLIFSLFKRHQRNHQINSKCPPGAESNSLGCSSAGANSGSPLVLSSGQSSSTESTGSNSNSNSNSNNIAATNHQRQLEHQQQLQFQLHQQQLQLQLQQQLQQLRPTISVSSCDFDYEQPRQQHTRTSRPDSSLRV